MHFSSLAFASLLTAVSADYLKVNYYASGGCQGFLNYAHPPAYNQCYDFDIADSRSANISDCYFGKLKCVCTFFRDRGCKGPYIPTTSDGNNCASSWSMGRSFQSVKCKLKG